MRKFGLAAGAAVLALALSAASALADATPQLAAGDPAAAGFDPAKLKLLDDAMDHAVDGGQVAGILTMVARHGKIVDVHLHGNKHMDADPVTRDTIFRMYSQTKPLVGVAMMMLYEQGLWSLDDPVTKFIPEFAHLKVLRADGTLEDAVRPPNMRELMTHTAGFGYGLRTGNAVDDAFRDKKVLASNGLKEMIDKIATIPLLYQPGTKWSYSAAVDIQGYIIEKLSGQSLSAFLHDHVFAPLGMKDTGFQVPAADAARLSGVFVIAPQTQKLLELTPALFPALQDFTQKPPMDSGGGGSVSTADDYALFCQMMLNKGTLNGVRILKPQTVALMEQDQLEPTVAPSQVPGGKGIGDGGLGFSLDDAVVVDPAKLGTPQGKGSIWWGGAAGTWFWIDPKNDLFFLGMVQRFGGGAAGNEGLLPVSVGHVYDALAHPEK
jgi:CubicO group peptidase (beta-lactamase class C family)